MTMTSEDQHKFHLALMSLIAETLKTHSSHPDISYMAGELDYAKHALFSSEKEAKELTRKNQ